MVVMDAVQAARSRLFVTPSPDTPSPSLRPCPPGVGCLRRTLARTTERYKRALMVCGLLAAMLWPGALAATPIEDVISLLDQARYAEARDALEALLEHDPDAPEARLLYGNLQAREGHFAEAIAVFENLRSDRPDLPEVHNNLAVLYARLGRLDDARVALVGALDLRPDDIMYDNLGDVYMQLAQNAYARAKELRADNAAASEPSASTDEDSISLAESAESPVPATTEGGVQEPAIKSQEPESTEASSPAPADASSGACVRAGKFKDRTAAAEAGKWMESRGAEAVEIRHEEHEAVKFYRVYLPAASSRKDAVAKMRELQGRGVQDVGLINEKPLTNAVSVGVFRDERNMRRRIAEMETLGYSALSEANTVVVRAYVIEARLPGDERAAVDGPWATAFPEHPIRRVDCPDRR